MGKKMPYWWLSCCLISVPALAANPAGTINAEQLSETQELPSLNGRVAPVATKAAPGTLQPLDAASARRALWGHPLMTLGVIARIHWQALRLWLKQAPFFRQPAAPADFVTPGHPASR